MTLVAKSYIRFHTHWESMCVFCECQPCVCVCVTAKPDCILSPANMLNPAVPLQDYRPHQHTVQFTTRRIFNPVVVKDPAKLSCYYYETVRFRLVWKAFLKFLFLFCKADCGISPPQCDFIFPLQRSLSSSTHQHTRRRKMRSFKLSDCIDLQGWHIAQRCWIHSVCACMHSDKVLRAIRPSYPKWKPRWNMQTSFCAALWFHYLSVCADWRVSRAVIG